MTNVTALVELTADATEATVDAWMALTGLYNAGTITADAYRAAVEATSGLVWAGTMAVTEDGNGDDDGPAPARVYHVTHDTAGDCLVTAPDADVAARRAQTTLGVADKRALVCDPKPDMGILCGFLADNGHAAPPATERNRADVTDRVAAVLWVIEREGVTPA